MSGVSEIYGGGGGAAPEVNVAYAGGGGGGGGGVGAGFIPEPRIPTTWVSANVLQGFIGKTITSVHVRDRGLSYEIVVTFTDGSTVAIGPEYDEGVVITSQ